MLISNMLNKEDYKILVAGGGEEAVRIARNERPNLILMDIMMPEMDGYSACLELKRDPSTKNIPVVIITALGQELNRKFAEQVGAKDYLTKPFTLEDIQSLVSRHLPPEG